MTKSIQDLFHLITKYNFIPALDSIPINNIIIDRIIQEYFQKLMMIDLYSIFIDDFIIHEGQLFIHLRSLHKSNKYELITPYKYMIRLPVFMNEEDQRELIITSDYEDRDIFYYLIKELKNHHFLAYDLKVKKNYCDTGM